jgi:hypothetical protein
MLKDLHQFVFHELKKLAANPITKTAGQKNIPDRTGLKLF